MKTEEQLRAEARLTDEGRLLVRYGFEPWDTESAARIVARKAAEDLTHLLTQIRVAMDYVRSHEYTECWDSAAREVRDSLNATLKRYDPEWTCEVCHGLPWHLCSVCKES